MGFLRKGRAIQSQRQSLDKFVDKTT